MTLKIYKTIGIRVEQKIVRGKTKNFIRNQHVGRNNYFKNITVCLLAALTLFTSFLTPEAQALIQQKYENVDRQQKQEQEITYKKLGFNSQLESKEYLNSIIEKITIKNSEDKEWSYNEKVMYANFMNLLYKDALQTQNKIQSKGIDGETNLIIRSLGKDLTGTYFAGTNIFLYNRWMNMNDNPVQRSIEIIAANLVEVYALQESGEPWQLVFGVNFDV